MKTFAAAVAVSAMVAEVAFGTQLQSYSKNVYGDDYYHYATGIPYYSPDRYDRLSRVPFGGRMNNYNSNGGYQNQSYNQQSYGNYH